jgi:hypothetical protein
MCGEKIHLFDMSCEFGFRCAARLRLWKTELQKRADELGVPITVCHLPPGTSKWNKIEHRLFSFITGNWRGKPLLSYHYQVIVQLIAATATDAGLTVRCQLDPNSYPTAIAVSNAQIKAVEPCQLAPAVAPRDVDHDRAVHASPYARCGARLAPITVAIGNSRCLPVRVPL